MGRRVSEPCASPCRGTGARSGRAPFARPFRTRRLQAARRKGSRTLRSRSAGAMCPSPYSSRNPPPTSPQHHSRSRRCARRPTRPPTPSHTRQFAVATADSRPPSCWCRPPRRWSRSRPRSCRRHGTHSTIHGSHATISAAAWLPRTPSHPETWNRCDRSPQTTRPGPAPRRVSREIAASPRRTRPHPEARCCPCPTPRRRRRHCVRGRG
mmetsp:Transcript_122000/g.352464  ORF Transcript_122000/g.352464 Transcript_122000/m.352464 type:complete len:210 (-) Transcript_122000:204-833(-)